MCVDWMCAVNSHGRVEMCCVTFCVRFLVNTEIGVFSPSIICFRLIGVDTVCFNLFYSNLNGLLDSGRFGFTTSCICTKAYGFFVYTYETSCVIEYVGGYFGCFLNY